MAVKHTEIIGHQLPAFEAAEGRKSTVRRIVRRLRSVSAGTRRHVILPVSLARVENVSYVCNAFHIAGGRMPADRGRFTFVSDRFSGLVPPCGGLMAPLPAIGGMQRERQGRFLLPVTVLKKHSK